MTRAVPSLPEKVTLDATDELLVSDISAGVSKKVKAENIASGVDKGSLSGELISADADNLLEQGTDSLLKVDADTVNSGDADNLMQVSDNKLKVDADNLISADANNTLTKGADEKIAVQVSDINSGDADNLLTEVSGKLKADASDFISADAGNFLVEGADNALKVDASSSISTDGSNAIVAGSDGGLFVAPAAVVDATETVKGVVEIATDAEANAGTDTGDTGATLVIKPSQQTERILDEGTFTSVSSLDIEPSFDDATFKGGYEITLSFNVSNDDTQLYIRQNVGGSYRSTGYSWSFDGNDTNSANTGQGRNDSQIETYRAGGTQGFGNEADQVANFRIWVSPTAEDSVQQQVQGVGTWVSSADYTQRSIFGGGYNTAGVLSGIRFFPTAGTFTGTYRVKGLR